MDDRIKELKAEAWDLIENIGKHQMEIKKIQAELQNKVTEMDELKKGQ
jgi:hypothetical protein